MYNLLLKKRNEKGFTLMEVLIVVAVIAILLAISIPVFTTQLEKSREATDFANMRAAKGLAVASYLTGEYDTEDYTYPVTQYYDAINGVLIDAAPAAYGKGTSNEGNDEIPGGLDYTPGDDYTDQVVKVEIGSDGTVTVSWVNEGTGGGGTGSGSQGG